MDSEQDEGWSRQIFEHSDPTPCFSRRLVQHNSYNTDHVCAFLQRVSKGVYGLSGYVPGYVPGYSLVTSLGSTDVPFSEP